jgi:hypothetical protein
MFAPDGSSIRVVSTQVPSAYKLEVRAGRDGAPLSYLHRSLA